MATNIIGLHNNKLKYISNFVGFSPDNLKSFINCGNSNSEKNFGFWKLLRIFCLINSASRLVGTLNCSNFSLVNFSSLIIAPLSNQYFFLTSSFWHQFFYRRIHSHQRTTLLHFPFPYYHEKRVKF